MARYWYLYILLKLHIRTNSTRTQQSCTETVPLEMVKALLSRSDLTQENQKTSSVAVCLNTAMKKHTNILENLTAANKHFIRYPG